MKKALLILASAIVGSVIGACVWWLAFLGIRWLFIKLIVVIVHKSI
jgi:hypothetical protein